MNEQKKNILVAKLIIINNNNNNNNIFSIDFSSKTKKLFLLIK